MPRLTWLILILALLLAACGDDAVLPTGASSTTGAEEPTTPTTAAPTTAAPTPSGTSYATHPTRNEAVAASPRILEEFPELCRPASAPRAQPAYEIAPLK